MDTNPDELTVLISETASDALEMPIEDLPPLSDAINIDALEAVATPPSATQPAVVTITFSYADLRVFVCSGNTVYTRPTRNEDTELLDRIVADGR